MAENGSRPDKRVGGFFRDQKTTYGNNNKPWRRWETRRLAVLRERATRPREKQLSTTHRFVIAHESHKPRSSAHRRDKRNKKGEEEEEEANKPQKANARHLLLETTRNY